MYLPNTNSFTDSKTETYYFLVNRLHRPLQQIVTMLTSKRRICDPRDFAEGSDMLADMGNDNVADDVCYRTGLVESSCDS